MGLQRSQCSKICDMAAMSAKRIKFAATIGTMRNIQGMPGLLQSTGSSSVDLLRKAIR